MSGSDDVSHDVTVSPQDILKRVSVGDYILNKKKNMKGSRAWEQFRIMLNPSNNDEVLGVSYMLLCVWYVFFAKRR